MNIQALMKQAQTLQKDMLKEKNEIDNTIFYGKNSLVNVEINGKKQILSVKIEADNLCKEDIEIVEDMIVLAINEAFEKVDKITEEKLGRFTNSMPGLF